MKSIIIALSISTLIATTIGSQLIQAQYSQHDFRAASSPSDIVDFNTQTLKYHDPNCIWEKRCTVHCIKISRAEAKKRGGIPCKVCNGGE
jgi:hypothetical protein